MAKVIPRTNNLMLPGYGVDSITENATGNQAILYKETGKKPSVTGIQSSGTTRMCFSQKDLQESVDVSGGLSLSSRLFGGGGGRVAFLNKHVLNATTVCLIVKEVALQHTELVEQEKLLPDALKLYNDDHALFLKTFGDSYVVGLTTGGVFYGALFIDCKDEERKRALTGELGIKLNAGLLKINAGVNYQKHFSEAASRGEFSVDVHVEGPERDFRTGDLDEMLRFASTFSTKVKGHPENQQYINAILKEYGSLWQSDGRLPDYGSALNDLNQRRKNVITKYADLISQAAYELESINHYKAHPEHFEVRDSDKLLQYEEKLNSLLIILNERASSCMTNPRCNINVDDLKLPQRDSFLIPADRQGSPLLLRYNDLNGKTKLELGNQKGSEQLCSDGTGRYILYENGIIISHPKYGTHEIYGRIFETYKKKDLEAGPLGYPKTGVRRLPNGEQIANFEYGSISDHKTFPEPRTRSQLVSYSPVMIFTEQETKNAIHLAGGVYGIEQNVKETVSLEDPSLSINIDHYYNIQGRKEDQGGST